MILNIEILILIFRTYLPKFQAKLRFRLANLKRENLLIKNNICGSDLDLHYNIRALAGDQVFDVDAAD